MRGFELQDTFKLSEILDVMDIQLDLNDLLDKAKAEKEKVQEKVGAQVALLVIKKLHKADKQIIEFISNITGEDTEVIKKYKPKQIKDFFIDLFNNEDFKDFFK
jgi:D-alanyl-D-alanine dipeptidase